MMMTPENRWNMVSLKLKELNEEKNNIEIIISDYLNQQTKTFTLSKDAKLNWQELSIVVVLDRDNNPVVHALSPVAQE